MYGSSLLDSPSSVVAVPHIVWCSQEIIRFLGLTDKFSILMCYVLITHLLFKVICYDYAIVRISNAAYQLFEIPPTFLLVV